MQGLPLGWAAMVKIVIENLGKKELLVNDFTLPLLYCTTRTLILKFGYAIQAIVLSWSIRIQTAACHYIRDR
jgi:hypothetical protein